MGSQNLEKEEMFFRRPERLYAHLAFQTQLLFTESRDTREAGGKQGKDVQ